MERPLLLHEVLAGVLSGVNYVISYDSITANSLGGGAVDYVLNGVCDFHHAQPGFVVTIDSIEYTIKDYDTTQKTLTVTGTEDNPINVLEFNLYRPKFVHGTPIEQQNELEKIDDQTLKQTLIYLMEPYEQKDDDDPISSIDRRCRFSLCFLTKSDFDNYLTEDFYHNAIIPMRNLFQDFKNILWNSGLFNNNSMETKPKFYTKFGINIKDSGTKKMYFAENLSGVGADFYLEIYRDDSCDCGDGVTFLSEDLGEFLQVS